MSNRHQYFTSRPRQPRQRSWAPSWLWMLLSLAASIAIAVTVWTRLNEHFGAGVVNALAGNPATKQPAAASPLSVLALHSPNAHHSLLNLEKPEEAGTAGLEFGAKIEPGNEETRTLVIALKEMKLRNDAGHPLPEEKIQLLAQHFEQVLAHRADTTRSVFDLPPMEFISGYVQESPRSKGSIQGAAAAPAGPALPEGWQGGADKI